MIPVELNTVVVQYRWIVLVVGVGCVLSGSMLRRSTKSAMNTTAEGPDASYTKQQAWEYCKEAMLTQSGSTVALLCEHGFGDQCMQRCMQQGVDYYRTYRAGEEMLPLQRTPEECTRFILWMDTHNAINSSN